MNKRYAIPLLALVALGASVAPVQAEQPTPAAVVAPELVQASSAAELPLYLVQAPVESAPVESAPAPAADEPVAFAEPVTSEPAPAAVVAEGEPAPAPVPAEEAPVAFEEPVEVPWQEGDPIAFEEPVEVPWQEGDPIAFEEPVEVAPQPGDPVVFGPETVYVEAKDGSLVPESELAAYEEYALTNPAPVTFGPKDLVEATDGSLVYFEDIDLYEAELAAGIPQAVGYTVPLPVPATK